LFFSLDYISTVHVRLLYGPNWSIFGFWDTTMQDCLVLPLFSWQYMVDYVLGYIMKENGGNNSQVNVAYLYCQHWLILGFWDDPLQAFFSITPVFFIVFCRIFTCVNRVWGKGEKLTLYQIFISTLPLLDGNVQFFLWRVIFPWWKWKKK
jgi:hypothetical protein